MTPGYSESILREIEAEIKLINLGWLKKPCASCNGSGRFVLSTKMVNELTTKMENELTNADNTCYSCDGRGWKWTAPQTKPC